MNVTSHRRRAFLLRAGVVASVTLGTVLAVGSSALAAHSMSASAVTLEVGGDAKAVNVQVTADTAAGINKATISAGSMPSGVSCSSGCGSEFPVGAGETVSRTIYLKASNSAAEGSSTGSLQLNGTPPLDPEVTASFPITVKPKPPTTVVEIAGTVKDTSTGEKLSDVLVVIADGAGKTFQDTTDGTGRFSFKTGGSTQIQAGTIRVAVSKDGFSAPMKSYSVAAGQSKTDISIAMTPKNAPSPSALPSAAESLEPSVDPNAIASTDVSASADTTGALDPAGDESDSGGLSWMMIVIGGLLVLLGIGAIALILMRRNNDDEDDDEDEDDVPVRRPQGPRVTTGYYGARPSPDPTMVARSPMADSPTTVQRPGEYGTRPQPAASGWTGYGQDARPTQVGGTYGSPAAPTSGYAGGAVPYGPQGGYGSPVAPTSSAQGYGAQGYGAQGYGQASGPAYGQASGPAYGQASGAGAHGQQHNGYGPNNGYGAQGSGYGQSGYDQGYGQPPSPSDYGQSGYGDQGQGYAPPSGYAQSDAGYGQSNGYGGGQANGYSGQSGYDSAGYAPQGGYESGGYGGQPGYGDQGYGQQGGYSQQGGGYVPEQRGGGYDQGAYNESTQRWSGGEGYGQGQSGGYDEQTRRSDRRLDWLDD